MTHALFQTFFKYPHMNFIWIYLSFSQNTIDFDLQWCFCLWHQEMDMNMSVSAAPLFPFIYHLPTHTHALKNRRICKHLDLTVNASMKDLQKYRLYFCLLLMFMFISDTALEAAFYSRTRKLKKNIIPQWLVRCGSHVIFSCICIWMALMW